MIVYCCADLIFATKISSTAQVLGIVSRPVRNANMLANRLDQVDDGKPCDAVDALLLDLEAGDHTLDMIDQARKHDPNLPVIVFAPHVQVDRLEQARQRGATSVLPRGAFTAQLPDLLATLAKTSG